MHPQSTISRFWSKVNKHSGLFWEGTECWLWSASCDDRGYGGFYVPGRGMVKAHRFAYELEHGAVPPGLYVCHHCDTPPCVRHLFAGTQFDNMRDMARKGRKITHGEHNSRACLTEADVRAIFPRTQTARHGMVAAIAREYGVTIGTISHIKNGRNWRHLGLLGQDGRPR